MDVRYYQSLIAKQALEANTIAFLPTGLGKTFVALFVLQQRLQIIQSSPQNKHKVIVLIAPKKALVNQHVHTLNRILKDVKVKELNGEATSKSLKPVDFWSKEEWKRELDGFSVLAMTPAIFRSMLEKNCLSDDSVDFLILDECHCATGQDEMARVCDLIKSKNYKPLILGLTASPIKSKKGNVLSAIIELEERTTCTFFLPSQDFIDSLSEHKTRADSFIFLYGERSSYDLNPMESAGLSNLESIHQHWQNLCERLDLADYVSQMIEHDRNFHTDIFSNLCHQLDPSNEMNLVESTEFSFKQFSGFSLWKKFLNQALSTSRVSGLLAASIGLSDLLVKSGNVYDKPISFGGLYNVERCKPHKNDETLLRERIVDIVKFCEFDKSGCFRLLLDQRCIILVTLIEAMRCLIALMRTNDEPIVMLRRIAANRANGIFGSNLFLKQAILRLVETRLYSTNVEDKEIWKEVHDVLEHNSTTTGSIFSIAGDIICSIKDYLLRRACKDIGPEISKWLTFSLLSPRIQTLFRILFTLKMTQHFTTSSTSSFDDPSSLIEFLKAETLGESSLLNLLISLKLEHVQLHDEHNPFNPKSISVLDWVKQLVVPNSSCDADDTNERNHSVIVFCTLRQSTIILSTLWNTIAHSIGVANDRKFKCGILHGHLALDEQKKTLNDFRAGKISILFSSEVAEEGIDVAKCRYVVHFDPPKTVKSQIQRRGRARAQDAQLIHLWPERAEYSDEYRQLLKMFTQFAKEEQHMNRLLHDISRTTRSFISDFYEQDTQSNKYRISTPSGASVDIISAQELIFRYCFMLRQRLRVRASEGDLEFRPYYRFSRDGNTHFFNAQLFLPSKYMTHVSAFGSIEFTGQASSKRISQGLAALRAVQWLLDVGEIDNFTLRPITKKIKSTMEWCSNGYRRCLDLDEDEDENVSEDEAYASQACQWLQKIVPSSLLPQDQANDSQLPTYHMYMYRITYTSKNVNEQDNATFRDKMHLEHIVILTQTPVLPHVIQEQGAGHPLTLYSSKHHSTKAFVSFELFGERDFSPFEMHWIERFHRGIVCMETVRSDENTRCFEMIPEYGIYSVATTAAVNIDIFFDADASHTTPREWSTSSNGACYWVCPLLELAKAPSLSRDTFLQSLIQATIEVETLMLNLQCIRERNEKNMPFLDIVLPTNASVDRTYTGLSEIVMDEMKRNEYVFTSGNSLFRFKSVADDCKLLSDIMESVDHFSSDDDNNALNNISATTFAKHYSRQHHPKRTNFINNCLEDEACNGGLPLNESILYRGYMLSGKLTWYNVLQPSQEGSESSEKARKPAYFLPAFSLPIGKLLWFQLTLLVPGVLYAFQSMAMAKEVQERIFSPLLRPLSLPVPDIDVVLTAMTTTRMQENLSLERLELIGDSFLKFASSVYIVLTAFSPENIEDAIHNLPHLTAERLTLMRQELITNKTLSELASSLDIKQFIRVIPFSNGYEELLFHFPGHSRAGKSLRCVNIQCCQAPPAVPQDTDDISSITHSFVSLGVTANEPVVSSLLQPSERTPLQFAKMLCPQGISSKVASDFVEALLGAACCVTSNRHYNNSDNNSDNDNNDNHSNNDKNNDIDSNNNSSEDETALHSVWELFAQLILRRSLRQFQNVSFAEMVADKWRHVLSRPVWTLCLDATENNDNTMSSSGGFSFAQDDSSARDEEAQWLRHELSQHHIVSHPFRHPSLLLLAVTHPSGTRHSDRFILRQDYELLEFVGDAVLDWLVVETLCRAQPHWDEAQLTQAKARLVCNETLARHSERIGVLPYVRHENVDVTRWTMRVNERRVDANRFKINNNNNNNDEDTIDFDIDVEVEVDDVEVEDGDLNEELRVTASTAEVEHKEVSLPVAKKILADVFEAILGAIFIDSGGRLSAVKRQLQVWGYWREVEAFQFKSNKTQ